MKLALTLLATTALSSVIGCAAPAATTKGEAKGETGSYLLSGTVLTAEQVADAVRQAGFPEEMVGKMVCTAKYESSFYEKASNGSHYGLFQIAKSHLGENGCASTVAQIEIAANNAACAFAVYQAQGMGAWEAYTSHKSTCDAYQAAGSSQASLDSADPTGTDDSVSGTQLAGDGVQGGGCYSSTDGTMVNDGACVQSRDYGLVQCSQGEWYEASNDGSCTASGSSDPYADDGSYDDYGYASVKTSP